ncbi:type II toxin-antitoxin system RelE/ParE family toxin [Rugamonas rivuli]|uniref:Type II toxin-antitoxin system RelE/ParE family toxin n=1 Tax=Rugamonas rivuli TaxID=2743358 RepID=A0A843S874_9BURK|nr:type II toxin-antitoxin system RelE/ParE family toxin [Rugamonas rivuli]MQA18972.1 type II toxin-antitoxin system RelE/ParE family toxin [Rugamonas rivuli]
MARLELMPEAIDDLDRILNFLVQNKTPNASTKIQEIQQSINVLKLTPLIGHSIRDGKRELFIGKRRHGYVVIYRYFADIDTVFVLAIQSQRQQRQR